MKNEINKPWIYEYKYKNEFDEIFAYNVKANSRNEADEKLKNLIHMGKAPYDLLASCSNTEEE